MAITQKLCNAGLTAGAHVFQASEDTAVTTIHLCNITSEDATVNVYILKSDGSTTVPTENMKIYNSLTIEAQDTYIIDTEKMILSTNDKIFVETPDSSGLIVATISTIGL
jgi:uncharacterized protein YcfL